MYKSVDVTMEPNRFRRYGIQKVYYRYLNARRFDITLNVLMIRLLDPLWSRGFVLYTAFDSLIAMVF